MRRTLTVAGAMLAIAVPLTAQDVVREGAGVRRAQLDEMELKEFPAEAWSALSEWTGEPASVEAGEVGLIVTFATWYAPSMTGASLAQRMADRYGDEGLKVVAVHDARGYDNAPEQLEQRKITIPVALDAEGKFRAALKVDQDPDFYLIDRAGRLRYADVNTRSVEAAVQELVAESRSDAADLPERLAAQRREAAALARRTGAINPEANLSDLPEFAIPDLGPEPYDAARWPQRWEEFEEDFLSRRNRRGEDTTITLSVPTEAVTFGKRLNTNGRATVVYFWLPGTVRSYQRVQPRMDLLAREKGRDVAVVGVLMPESTDDRRSRDMTAEDVAEQARKFEQQVRKARSERVYDHSIVVDPSSAILTQILGDGGRGRRQEFPVPLAAIFSSDMKLRWIGSPLDSRFDAALGQILRVDPGIQMRRSLEENFIRDRGK